MDLGAFSISLSVKDLKTSEEFYQKLGFETFGGHYEHNYLMMKNGEHVIGLFQGMFEKNVLTFNPGWDQHADNLDDFTDIRELYRKLKEDGIELTNVSVDTDEGPASFSLLDPDGNPILIDQHR